MTFTHMRIGKGSQEKRSSTPNTILQHQKNFFFNYKILICTRNIQL